jgi:hypothetical protein
MLLLAGCLGFAAEQLTKRQASTPRNTERPSQNKLFAAALKFIPLITTLLRHLPGARAGMETVSTAGPADPVSQSPSGSSLSAQARYAAGTLEILECWLSGKPIRDEYLIVDGGRLAGTGAHSYSAGNATGGSEEAVRFRGTT